MIKKRYNLMLNPAVVSRVDYHAEQLCISRSELINSILYNELKEYDGVDPEYFTPEILGQVKFENNVKNA